jgi:hypothetical protein
LSVEAPGNPQNTAASSVANHAALAMVTSLFFLWGFLTVLNDVLVPHFRNVFTLNYTQAMLIQFSFFLGYVVTALPSGWVVGRIGYKTSMVIALAIMGTGALLFLPAADLASYPLFLAALLFWPRESPCCRSPATLTYRSWVLLKLHPAALTWPRHSTPLVQPSLHGLAECSSLPSRRIASRMPCRSRPRGAW